MSHLNGYCSCQGVFWKTPFCMAELNGGEPNQEKTNLYDPPRISDEYDRLEKSFRNDPGGGRSFTAFFVLCKDAWGENLGPTTLPETK